MLAALLAAASSLAPCGGQGIGGTPVKHWPLLAPMPYEPNVTFDGSSAGPRGVAIVTEHNGGACHLEFCNQLRSEEPHVMHITWCADTTGRENVGCSLDIGYRSQEGASRARFGFSTAGLNASADSYAWEQDAAVVLSPADSKFPLSKLGTNGDKNVIDTVYGLVAPGGAGNNLPLSATSGFCCRLEFSGAKTVTGTIYVGNLLLLADVSAPSPLPSHSPSASGTPTQTPSASVSSSSTATSTSTSTSTATATFTPLPAAAAAAAAPDAALSLSTGGASGLVIGAALAGAAATLALQLVMRRLSGARGGAAAAAFALSGAGAAGAGAGASAARERAALLGAARTAAVFSPRP
jgi:hypothetical protein